VILPAGQSRIPHRREYVGRATLTESTARHLIEQTAQGNQHPFEKLCQAYEKPLFRMINDIIGDPELADEVMQNARLAIWQSAREFRGVVEIGSRHRRQILPASRRNAVDLNNSRRQ